MAFVVGVDIADDDVGIAEGGAGQNHLQAIHQRFVAAPVDVKGVALLGRSRRCEVGDDIAAPEREDGLFGIADQDEGGLSAEGPVDDLPLNGIGVLELIDHHDRPSAAHPVPGG